MWGVSRQVSSIPGQGICLSTMSWLEIQCKHLFFGGKSSFCVRDDSAVGTRRCTLRRVRQDDHGSRWKHKVWACVTAARLPSNTSKFPAPNKGTQGMALSAGPGVLSWSPWICHPFCCMASDHRVPKSGLCLGRILSSLVLRTSEVISLVLQRKTGWLHSAPGSGD